MPKSIELTFLDKLCWTKIWHPACQMRAVRSYPLSINFTKSPVSSQIPHPRSNPSNPKIRTGGANPKIPSNPIRKTLTMQDHLWWFRQLVTWIHITNLVKTFLTIFEIFVIFSKQTLGAITRNTASTQSLYAPDWLKTAVCPITVRAVSQSPTSHRHRSQPLINCES